MGLDITFTSRKNVICPHCKTVVATEDVYLKESGGRVWYDILESLGYYVPYDKRTEENGWYGKDMVLNAEQTRQLYDFVREHSDVVYNAQDIIGLIANAIVDGNSVVIHANW